MNIRCQKRLIALVYHSIILVLFVVGMNTANSLLIIIGIADLLTFRKLPLVKNIQAALLKMVNCPNCQKELALTDHWQCSCGYSFQTQRHIFLPCPNCGKSFTFIACSNCDATILI